MTRVATSAAMQFSESSGMWREIPSWAKFLIRLGFDWPQAESEGPRRIGLISMPCDSAAAGLIALGAMRRRLESADANDLTSHFRRIQALASPGQPKVFLRHAKERGLFVTDGKHSSGLVWAKHNDPTSRTRMTIALKDALNWHFVGEPPVRVLSGGRIPYSPIYDELVPDGGPVATSNLAHSDSGLCLAGRATGESGTKSALAAIRFQTNGSVSDLSELLTVHGWSLGAISRVSFFNARTRELDRCPRQPTLVVADGDASFLRVIEEEEFRESDLLGVIHRSIDRDRLESVGHTIANLSQWYAQDSELLGRLSSAPRGIGVTILRRR